MFSPPVVVPPSVVPEPVSEVEVSDAPSDVYHTGRAAAFSIRERFIKLKI